MSSPEPALLPSDLKLRPLVPEDAAAIVALISACDRTYLEWAPESAPARAFYERYGWNANGVREFKDDLGMWMVEYETSLAAPDTGLT